MALPGWAEDGGGEASARAHFEAGSEAVRRGELTRAAEEFELAQSLSPNPVVLYNLGQTYSALGQPVKAERAFRLYLTSQPPPTDRARIAEVEAMIAFNVQRIGTVLVELVPADATLEVDGSPAELLAPGRLRLAAGRHVLVATRDGYETSILNLDVAASVETPARVALAPAAPVASATSRPPAGSTHAPAPAFAANKWNVAPPAPATSGERITSYVLLAVGAAALGTGAIFAFEANRLNHASNRDGHCNAAGCDDPGLRLRAVAFRDGNWATGWVLGGAVTSTAGFVLYLLEHRDSRARLQGAARLLSVNRAGSELSLALPF